jgi:hypothetical protein
METITKTTDVWRSENYDYKYSNLKVSPLLNKRMQTWLCVHNIGDANLVALGVYDTLSLPFGHFLKFF